MNLPPDRTPHSPLLTPAATARRLGISLPQLATLRRTGTAPLHYLINPRLIRYNRTATEHHPQKHPTNSRTPQ